MDLSGKVALVTGASKGIGAAIADLLRARGVRLALTALPEAGFEAHVSPDSLVIPGDLTSDDFCDALVQQTAAHFGRIDILVNNAGVGLYATPSQAPLPLVRKLFDLNVFAPLRLAQLVTPPMRRQGGVSL